MSVDGFMVLIPPPPSPHPPSLSHSSLENSLYKFVRKSFRIRERGRIDTEGGGRLDTEGGGRIDTREGVEG